MSEKPIIFSAPMVRAILAGTKTQTRRILKPQPEIQSGGLHMWNFTKHSGAGSGDVNVARNAWAEHLRWMPGDTLWVREACRAEEIDDPKSPDWGLDGVRYLADDKFIGLPEIRPPSMNDNRWIDLAYYGRKEFIGPIKNVPSIHMPRWASRITLLVEAVRVERLQEISEADAQAEGTPDDMMPMDVARMPYPSSEAQGRYAALWDRINGPGAWDANPWVSVTTFRRIKP